MALSGYNKELISVGDVNLPIHGNADLITFIGHNGLMDFNLSNYPENIDNKKFPNGPWCQVGDYVAYGRHVGHKFVYKDTMLILIFDDQVIMKVEKPEYLDTMFNLSG